MADLGELVLKLNIDDVGFNRDLERAKARAASFQDITVGLRPDRSFNATDDRIRELQRRRIELTAQLDTGAQFARLEAEIDALNRRQIRLNVNAAGVDAQLQKIAGDISRLEARRLKLQADPNAAAESINQIDNQIKVLEARRLRLNLNRQEVTTEIGQIEARLRGIDDERVNVNINADRARTEIAKIDTQLAVSRRSVEDLGQSFDRLDAVVAGAAAGITNQIVQGISNAIGSAVETLREFGESSLDLAGEYRSQIAGLTSVTGSLDAANAAYDKAGETANRYGLAQNKVIGSYTQLAAAANAQGIQQGIVNDLFDSAARSLALTGASTEQQGRAFTALTQIFSKGRVQAEELTGQLAEALPSGLGILAKGLNTTVPELLKFVSTGQFTAEQFAQAFIRGAQDIEGAVDPTNAALARLSNSYLQFQIGVGQALQPLQIIVSNALSGIITALQEAGASGAFAPFTTAIAALSTTLESTPAIFQGLSSIAVEVATTISTVLGGAINGLVAQLQANPEAFIAGLRETVASIVEGVVSLSQVVGQAFSFISQNFDAIVQGAKFVAAGIAAIAASSVVAGIVSLGSAIAGVAGAIGGAITAVAGILSAGGFPALVAAAGTALSGLAAAAAPVAIGIGAIAAAVGVAVAGFRLLQNENVQSVLAAIGQRARELFDAFRNSEPIRAVGNVLGAVGEVIRALIPRIGQLIGFLGRLAAQGIQGLIQQFTNTDSVTRQILGTLTRFNPILQGVLALARLVADAFTGGANAAAEILRNLANILRRPQEFQGGNTEALTGNIDAQTESVGRLGETLEQAKTAADELDGSTPQVQPPAPAEGSNPIDAEKERQRLIEQTERQIDADKRARQEQFDDERRDRELALEDEKQARQLRFEDLKRSNALALERQVESVKLRAEQQIEALKEEGRRREAAFRERQRQEEQALTDRQNAEKLAFEDELNRRRNAAERQLSLDEAGSLDEQNRLVEQFAREDRRAQVLAPFEQEERDFETRQLAERRAFEEQQRKDAAIFAEQQRQLEAQAQQIKAQSEAEIRQLNYAAKEQEIALERAFNANERDAARAAADQERARQRAFNAEQRRLDEASARRIEQLKAGNNVQTITPRRHGGPVGPGQTYLAGEAGPELLRMGGKEALITKPSLMRFDQPGRIYSAPQTRRRLATKGMMGAPQMATELLEIRKLLSEIKASPRGDIQTNVNVNGISGDQVRRQLVRHQMDLYRGLGGL